MTIAEEVAQILLKIKAVTLRPDQPYKYTNGLLSPVYTDCRLLISYPKERARVSKLLAELIDQPLPDVIAATATAGIPHGAWVAEKLELPMVYARSKVKSHGKGMKVEGVIKPGQRIVVVEDLISTAGSSIETTEVVREAGGKVEEIVAIVSYGLPQSVANLKAANVKLKVLTTFADVVKMAAQDGYMAQKDKEMVVAWAEDSQNWASKNGFA